MATYLIQSTRQLQLALRDVHSARMGTVSWQAAAERLANAVRSSVARHRDRPGMGHRPVRLLNRDVFFAASEHLQLTQRALSRSIGLAEDTLGKIVSHQRGASAQTIEALSAALGVSPNDLFFASAYREGGAA
ncbi:MAG: helix-turn-helix transcriptional regulator [Chloroflexi bacterium]|nr:helix-turn-helix transcriptional regulator [Chloroflexota bacterium]